MPLNERDYMKQGPTPRKEHEQYPPPKTRPKFNKLEITIQTLTFLGLTFLLYVSAKLILRALH